MEKKKKKWMKFRHKVVRNLLCWAIFLYTRWFYGVRIEKFRQQGNRQYLILLNHQTTFDQFFVGLAFKGPVYYMATEDIFSLGWISSVIRYLVAPIPIKKQTTDIQAVMTTMKVAKEGGTIAIAPEGNRTYNGRTVYMNPAIAPLVRKLKLPVALFRIEGGYGVQPRWSDVLRKGKMRAYVSEVLEPEAIESMTNEQLMDRIRQGLYVDEAAEAGTYRHKKAAEYLERAIYVCPYCGLSEFESHGDIVECKKCRRQVRYLPSKRLEGVGFEFPFPFVAQWYDYQQDVVNALDPDAYRETPLYRDTADLSEVIVYERKQLLRKAASFALYGDRVAVDEGKENELALPFGEVSAVSVLGRNKLNIYHNKTVYQVKGDKRFNALKYVNIFYRYKNISKGDNHGKFLGL